MYSCLFVLSLSLLDFMAREVAMFLGNVYMRNLACWTNVYFDAIDLFFFG